MRIETVGDLKAELDYYADDMPLRVALQPSYPLGGYVENVVSTEDLWMDDDDDDDSNENAVWIAVSDGEDYSATREMWQ
jgi:hypothetical protein